MNGETRINKVSVRQYMDVINNPDRYASGEPNSLEVRIWDKFKYCALSHQTPERERKNQNMELLWPDKAWGAFNVILVALQYLDGDRGNWENAVELGDLFDKYVKDKKLNPSKLRWIFGSNAEMFIFGMGEIIKHAFFIKPEKTTDDRVYFDQILGKELNKESTIEEVIRQLWPQVTKDAQKKHAFQEVASRGFDVGSPLRNRCAKLYRAGARQIVFTGAPGTGKSYTAKVFAESTVKAYARANGNTWDEAELKEHIMTVQFHSGYDYTDFVEGLRPVQIGEKNEMSFVRLDGKFKEFCRKIQEQEDKDKNAPYFFIIDEINRADLSRVFGELMFCLDESKRPNAKEGKAGETVKTQYSNLPTYRIDDKGNATVLSRKDDVYWDGFFIPENLCILATMNDIDRSVETFDFALRRRFKWIEANANDEMENGLRGMLGSKVSDDKIKLLTENIIAMNKVIAGAEDSKGEQLRLTKEYHIGHAYFEKFTGDNLQDIWDTQIEQILREYCRGRSNASRVDAFVDACMAALFKNYDEN